MISPGLLMLLAAAPVADASSVTRLETEQRELRDQLLARCPKESASIAALAQAAPAQRVELLLKLERCAAGSEAFLIQLGNGQNLVGKYRDAEATFRDALARRASESAMLGILTALSRQKPHTEAQTLEMKAGLDHFRKAGCTRDDICAGLAYVAWHADDTELTISAAEKAIALGFPGWQPWFAGGTAYAMSAHKEDRARSIKMLKEARKRGGPAKQIDDFLTRLGAEP